MKHGSLFSGIGGFDLAAEWMGWENVFHCEIAEFPRKILNYYWSKAESYEDIKKTDFTKWCGTVDIISGGFPCQPYSSAGKRLGKEDDRHLWPEMLRVIREVKPQWVVGENVRGLLNWNDGLVFHEVCSDLENIGYEVQAFIIPASGLNAPHQRERLWVVAHSNGNECKKRGQSFDGREINKFENGVEIWDKSTPDGKQRNAPDPKSKRLQRGFNNGQSSKWIQSKFTECNSFYEFKKWKNFPTQSPVCGGNDGISHGLDNITFSKWRNESIKGYGNAIVPQVAYRIFKTIEYIQNLK